MYIYVHIYVTMQNAKKNICGFLVVSSSTRFYAFTPASPGIENPLVSNGGSNWRFGGTQVRNVEVAAWSQGFEKTWLL